MKHLTGDLSIPLTLAFLVKFKLWNILYCYLQNPYQYNKQISVDTLLTVDHRSTLCIRNNTK